MATNSIPSLWGKPSADSESDWGHRQTDAFLIKIAMQIICLGQDVIADQ